jgi:hypothetical protein
MEPWVVHVACVLYLTVSAIHRKGKKNVHWVTAFSGLPAGAVNRTPQTVFQAMGRGKKEG